jgi:hypothetical protein
MTTSRTLKLLGVAAILVIGASLWHTSAGAQWYPSPGAGPWYPSPGAGPWYSPPVPGPRPTSPFTSPLIDPGGGCEGGSCVIIPR